MQWMMVARARVPADSTTIPSTQPASQLVSRFPAERRPSRYERCAAPDLRVLWAYGVVVGRVGLEPTTQGL